MEPLLTPVFGDLPGLKPNTELKLGETKIILEAGYAGFGFAGRNLYHHTAYHRGYVGDMMFNVPEHRAPVTDLPVFLREVPQNYY